MADPHELPVEKRCIEVFTAMLKNTTKPVTFWYHDRASAKFLNEIMIAVRGDEKTASEYPLCYPFFEPISPLRFPFNGIDLLFETSRLNLPVPIGPMAQMGMSAPATIAGTIAQQNAEILAGICVSMITGIVDTIILRLSRVPEYNPLGPITMVRSRLPRIESSGMSISK